MRRAEAGGILIALLAQHEDLFPSGCENRRQGIRLRFRPLPIRARRSCDELLLLYATNGDKLHLLLETDLVIGYATRSSPSRNPHGR
jgi:hypothetical protein